jgi:hypothetical protein
MRKTWVPISHGTPTGVFRSTRKACPDRAPAAPAISPMLVASAATPLAVVALDVVSNPLGLTPMVLVLLLIPLAT